MKVLGVKQFHQKTFKFLNLKKCKFKKLLGNIPKHFILVVYGFTGNGKTEFVMMLVKMLSRHGKVLWLSYEQRHGSDLQMATMRNEMEDESGRFLISDPLADLPEDVSLLEDLDRYLEKRGSADYIVLDSLDYTEFTMEDYKYLKTKYDDRKSFIFIAHSSKNGTLKKRISERIIFDGGMGFFVSNFIVFPEKNRYGGFEPFVVFEEQARIRNPAFFAKGTDQK